jgi:hypothetical protein
MKPATRRIVRLVNCKCGKLPGYHGKLSGFFRLGCVGCRRFTNVYCGYKVFQLGYAMNEWEDLCA